MQPIHGDLSGTTVLVTKPKEVGRLYSKSRFGTTLPGNKLQLHLLEAVFLCGEQKMQVFSHGKMLAFADLVHRASIEIPRFELLYCAYRDLRKRGHCVNILPYSSAVSFTINAEKATVPTAFVYVCSEQDSFTLQQLIDLCLSYEKHPLWITLIDEEGDITYYTLDLLDLRGRVSSLQYGSCKAALLDNRTVVFDKKSSEQLHDHEFFGKPFGEGLQLSLVETLYLIDIGVVQLYTPGHKKPMTAKTIQQVFQKKQPDIFNRLLVFKDLKNRRMLVKTGFKFGTHFRVYTQNPNQIHAEYLVHVVASDCNGSWAEISRGIRLAHAVNKVFVFASLSQKNLWYLSLGRLRP